MIIPKNLKRLIAQRKCVAFVGAGYSMPVGMPSWYGLLESVLNASHEFAVCEEDQTRIQQIEEALKSNDLLLAAALAKRLFGTTALNQHVAKCFSRKTFYESSEERQDYMRKRLNLLIDVPWKGIITTNYDDLIEMGLEKKNEYNSYYNVTDAGSFGNSLTQADTENRFFTKLHGCIRSQRFVLGPEEYDRVYLADPKIKNYMTAVMLNYHLIFLGCSLEDELLRLRRKLCLDFEGEIPIAYALMPSSPKNLARRFDLLEYAKIQCLLYPESDHESLDTFLFDIDSAYREDFGLRNYRVASQLQTELLTQSTEDRIALIGETNRNLIQAFSKFGAGATINQLDLIQAVKETLTSNGHANISDAEIVYRAHFLASIELLIHRKENSGTDTFEAI